MYILGTLWYSARDGASAFQPCATLAQENKIEHGINCRHVCGNSQSMVLETAVVDLCVCVLDPGRSAGRSGGRSLQHLEGGGPYILEKYKYTSIPVRKHNKQRKKSIRMVERGKSTGPSDESRKRAGVVY